MTDEEFRAWLFAPLSLADLLRIELAAAARQFALIEAAERADELADDVETAAVWNRVAADVALRDLAEAPPNPYPERRPRRRRPRTTGAALPSTSAMIRRVTA